MYGNTRHIADAIAEGLRTSVEAEVRLVGDVRAEDVSAAQLVVVGAPTHAWSLSRRSTRQSAATDAGKHAATVDVAAVEVGVREWLRDVTPQRGCRSAAFDTRLDKPHFFTGSAMRAIERGLLAAGFSIFGKSHSFRVTGSTGPLAVGELERATQWGEAMGRTLVQVVSAPKAA